MKVAQLCLTLCIRWPKYWSFSINPSNEYSGLISFRMDWFDLLAVQGIQECSKWHAISEPASTLNSFHYPYSSLLPWVCVQTPVQFLVRKILWRRDRLPTPVSLGFHCGSASKESACNAGDLDLIPGLGRSPGEGNGYPLQYSGLENSMDSP